LLWIAAACVNAEEAKREVEREGAQAMDVVEARHRERPGCGAARGHVVGRGHVQLQPGVQDGAAAGDDRRGVHGEPVQQLALHRGGGVGRNSHPDRLPRVSGTCPGLNRPPTCCNVATIAQA
jgi:hypothetical protein